MNGVQPGMADALSRFTRPVSGTCFWCPPLKNLDIDPSAVGL
jgi:putative iron-dependent peroxidase